MHDSHSEIQLKIALCEFGYKMRLIPILLTGNKYIIIANFGHIYFILYYYIIYIHNVIMHFVIRSFPELHHGISSSPPMDHSFPHYKTCQTSTIQLNIRRQSSLTPIHLCIQKLNFAMPSTNTHPHTVR